MGRTLETDVGKHGSLRCISLYYRCPFPYPLAAAACSVKIKLPLIGITYDFLSNLT